MRKVAISTCLLGEKCRYDATDNKNETLLETLTNVTLIPFCPEAYAFGTPRPTMDLIETAEGIEAISNQTGKNLSSPVENYAKVFFDANPDIDLFIGKDRSPSCGVCSGKLYNKNRELISSTATGLMAKEARKRGIESFDAEAFILQKGFTVS